MRVVASSAIPFVKPDVFIEGPDLAFFGLPSARFSEAGRRAVITVPVSALRGDGISHLLEMILLQADVLELKANPKAAATGVVIEAEIEIGRGPTATVLVENGTLRVGDSVVCGPFYAKVRAMFDDQGKSVKEARPSSAVRVIGWSGTPECGGIVKAVKNQRRVFVY